jgi:hypothetical protein
MIDKTVNELFVREAESIEIEPSQIGSLREHGLHRRKMAAEIVVKKSDIRLEILEHLMQPVFTVGESGFGTDIGKDVATSNFVAVEIAEETFAEGFVGTVADRTAEASHIESFAGSHEGDGDVARVLADSAKADMFMSRECEVGMYFVGDDIDIIAVADVSQFIENLFAPDGATRVVGVGENHPLTLMRPPFKVFKINSETAINYFERAAHQLAVPALGKVEEWRVDRSGN